MVDKSQLVILELPAAKDIQLKFLWFGKYPTTFLVTCEKQKSI